MFCCSIRHKKYSPFMAMISLPSSNSSRWGLKGRRWTSTIFSLLLLLMVGCCNAWSCNNPIGIQSCGSGRSDTMRINMQKWEYDDDNNSMEDDTSSWNRRKLLTYSTKAVMKSAAAATFISNKAEAATTTTTTTDSVTNKDATVTHIVTMNVRVARSDGTFYVRDNNGDSVDDEPLYVALKLELFGKDAPKHVEQFLSYCKDNTLAAALDDDTAPMPSYGKSNFVQFDQSTGLLMGGAIPGLELVSPKATTNNNLLLSSSAPVMEYFQRRILPAPLWIEKDETSSGDDGTSKNRKRALLHSHNQKGLLTHRDLEPMPLFGITTRANTPDDGLDFTHTIFGKIMMDEDATTFLNCVVDLPTYSVQRSRGMTDPVSSSVYSFQKDFFRSAAKTFGDTRLSSVYEGKILRRIEVTRIDIQTLSSS